MVLKKRTTRSENETNLIFVNYFNCCHCGYDNRVYTMRDNAVLVLDTHNKFTLLCIVFCFAIFIWTCKDMVYVYRCTFTKIKEYFSFRFQKDEYGFEKEEYCKPERKTADKYKKGE